jgi:hypothetical protein
LQFDYRGVRIALGEAFYLSELKVLCTDPIIDWDEIAGIRKSEKIANIIMYTMRHNKPRTYKHGQSRTRRSAKCLLGKTRCITISSCGSQKATAAEEYVR